VLLQLLKLVILARRLATQQLQTEKGLPALNLGRN
jgi:hypothetical protein